MLRELTRDEAEVLDGLRSMAVGGPFTASELAGPDVSLNTVEKMLKGDLNLTVAKLRSMARRARRQDCQGSLDLVQAVLGAEYVVSLSPAVEAPEALMREAAEASAATGEVQQAVLDATADGVVDAEEAEGLGAKARRAMRQLQDVVELADRVALRGQPHLAGVR